MKYISVEKAAQNLFDWSEGKYTYDGYDDIVEFYSGNLTDEKILQDGCYKDGRRWMIVDGSRSEKTKIFEMKK